MKYRMVDVCEHNFIKNLSGEGGYSPRVQSQNTQSAKICLNLTLGGGGGGGEGGPNPRIW